MNQRRQTLYDRISGAVTERLAASVPRASLIRWCAAPRPAQFELAPHSDHEGSAAGQVPYQLLTGEDTASAA